MMVELNFFLILQIKQIKEDTFINQTKYMRKIFKKFEIDNHKLIKTPMSPSCNLDKDEMTKISILNFIKI